MKIPIRNLYYLLSYAWDHVRLEDIAEATALDLETVPDLLAYVLAHGVARLISRGLDRAYEPVGAALRTVKGKLDPMATNTMNLRPVGMAYCYFDELSVDVLQNRLLRSTLGRLAVLTDLDRDVRASVERVYRRLAGVRTVRIDRRSLGSVQVHRNNKSYAFLLGICRLLHDSLSVDEPTGQVRFAGLPEERIATLFEEFAYGFYQRELQGWHVSRPHLSWQDAEGSEADLGLLPVMRTDAVLRSPTRRIIVDAKYYISSFQSYYGKASVDSSNLYQIVTYVRNAACEYPDGPPWEGMLLYPAVEAGFRHRYRLLGHPVSVVSVDLSQDWRSIREELLSLVGATPAGSSGRSARLDAWSASVAAPTPSGGRLGYDGAKTGSRPLGHQQDVRHDMATRRSE